MANWSSGYKWEPSGQAQPSLWDAIDTSVSYPDVIIGNTNRCTITSSLTWFNGRESWFDEPQPGSAQAVLYGRITDIAIGDPFVIRADPVGVLWTGRVDEVSFDVEPDGTATNVGASNWFSLLEGVKRPTTVVSLQDLMGRVAQLAAYAGAPTQTALSPSDSALPILLAGTDDTSHGLLQYLAVCEEASNAITAIGPDGTWWVVGRSPLPSGATPNVIPLEEDECPDSASLSYASPDRLFNSFLFAGAAAVEPSATSIAKYGRIEYTVPASKSASPLYVPAGSVDPLNLPVYYDNLLLSLVDPLPFGSVVIRVADRNSPLLGLPPFSYVSFDNRVWQVLSQDWSVDPPDVDADGDTAASNWYVTLGLATTQNELGHRAPPPVKPPVTRETVTVTWNMDRDAYVVKTTGGLNTGNGGSDNLLIGLLSDGNLCRTLMRPALAFAGSNIIVKTATLNVWTSGQECLQFGSSPTIAVFRSGTAWAEGSYATKCSFASGNAVVWPGPGVSHADVATKNFPKTEDTKVGIDVRGIVAAWVAGSPNYGFNLRGNDESSSTDRMELCSRTRSSTTRRPTLTVTYERDKIT